MKKILLAILFYLIKNEFLYKNNITIVFNIYIIKKKINYIS